MILQTNVVFLLHGHSWLIKISLNSFLNIYVIWKYRNLIYPKWWTQYEVWFPLQISLSSHLFISANPHYTTIGVTVNVSSVYSSIILWQNLFMFSRLLFHFQLLPILITLQLRSHVVNHGIERFDIFLLILICMQLYLLVYSSSVFSYLMAVQVY
jgi:hypothetical protein